MLYIVAPIISPKSAILALLLVVGCAGAIDVEHDTVDGSATDGSATTSAAVAHRDADATDCTLIPTPGGYAPRGCVLEIPNGASATTNDAGHTLVSVDGGLIADYPPCACAPWDADTLHPPLPPEARDQ